jgi:cell division protein FtsB
MSAGGTRRPARPRPRIQRDRPRLTGRAAFLLVAISALALMAIVPVSRFLEQRAAIADLERRTGELEALNADLRVEISRLHDPAELERLARECLGMVAAGEVVFITAGKRSGATDC